MQISKTRRFLSDWAFHVVIVAITLPILGFAYLAWTILPTPIVNGAPLAAETAHWRASNVIGAFQAAGLTARVVHGAAKDERDGFSAFRVIEAVRFRISENDKEMGMVLCFETAADREQVQSYFLALNRSLPQFRSWLFVKDNILLQINHEVPEQEARAYANILETLDQ